MSPSEPACSLVSATTGPATASSGYEIDLRPARGCVADALARDLLEQQLRHVAAAVVAHVDDQRVAVAFGDEVAVELGEAGGHHVGQMEVADAAVRLLVHPARGCARPIRGSARAPRRRASSPARCASRTMGAARGERQLDLGRGLMHQQRLRRAFARRALAVDRDDALADLRLDADRIQRRIGAGVPRVAGDDARDLVAAVGVDERANRRRGSRARSAAGAGGRRPSRTRATCRARPASPRSGPTARRASTRARAAARSGGRPRPSRRPTCRQPRTGRAAAARPRAASAAIRGAARPTGGCGRGRSSRSCATARPRPRSVRGGQRRACGSRRSRAGACLRARAASRDRRRARNRVGLVHQRLGCAASRSRTPRAGPALPCARRGRARRRSAAPSTRPCRRARPRSGRSGSPAPGTARSGAAMPSRSTGGSGARP